MFHSDCSTIGTTPHTRKSGNTFWEAIVCVCNIAEREQEIRREGGSWWGIKREGRRGWREGKREGEEEGIEQRKGVVREKANISSIIKLSYQWDHDLVPYQGRMVVSPYVGMAQKQKGSSNGCISNYMTITRLGMGFVRFKALACHIQTLPSPTRTSTSPKNITKVANRQPGKMWFLSSFLFFSSSSSARLAL